MRRARISSAAIREASSSCRHAVASGAAGEAFGVRGVLLVLVVLPDGSRSLIPAEWTDWRPEQADRTPADDVGDGDHDLGRLGDLLRHACGCC